MVMVLSLTRRKAVDDIFHCPKTKSESFHNSESPLAETHSGQCI